MTFLERTFYTVRCDWPECKEVDDGGEYAAWAEPEQAEEQAYDGFWAIEEVSSNRPPLTFCAEHRRHGYWLSDGPGDGYSAGTDITPLLEDAFVVPFGDHLVVCR